MNNKWRDTDGDLDLHLLMLHFGFKLKESKDLYTVYKNKRETYIVIATEKGHRYYDPSNPELKLAGFDLILDRMSKTEGSSGQGIWQKVEDFYSPENLDAFKLKDQNKGSAVSMFNHFNTYIESYQMVAASGIWQAEPFKGRAFDMGNGELAFPLYNQTNTLTGYIKDNGQGIELLGHSSEHASIWFSNIPKKIKKLMVFSSPVEAMAFHRRFNPEGFVYISLGQVNHEKSRILTQIHQRSRSGKIGLSFTGKGKMMGYVNDLMMLSFLNDDNFLLRTGKSFLTVQFNPGKEAELHKIAKDVKKYNTGVHNDYLGFNKIIDQPVVSKKLLHLGKKGDKAICKIPFDISAVKFFLWSYYRTYMEKSIDILKPISVNWERDFLEHGQYSGSEMEREHRIAV